MPEGLRLRVGYSPCPNDTFAFWALAEGLVPLPGVAIEPVLADIEALNVRAFSDDPLEVTKLSLPALARAGGYRLLDSGAALGRGCGPLVVRRRGGPAALADLAGRRVAIPGRNTTAWLLLGLYAPPDLLPLEMRFSEVMPAVAAGSADAGLIIHESRFTYPRHGLERVADLGELWEEDTGLPLPLGVIAARTDLPAEVAEAFERALAESVRRARGAPELPWGHVREHSQELDEAVCREHIALYVNDFTASLGEEGRRAIEALLERGRARGLLPAEAGR